MSMIWLHAGLAHEQAGLHFWKLTWQCNYHSYKCRNSSLEGVFARQLPSKATQSLQQRASWTKAYTVNVVHCTCELQEGFGRLLINTTPKLYYAMRKASIALVCLGTGLGNMQRRMITQES